MKKRVLIVTDFFFPHWTGISKSIYNMATGVKTVGFDVLAVRHKKNLAGYEKIRGVGVFREPYLFSLSRALYSPFVLIKMIKMIRNYDAVLINSPSSNIFPAALITKLFGKKLLIFHQGDLILPQGLLNRVIEKVFDASTFVAFFLSDRVASYSKDYAISSRVIKPFLKKFTPLLLPVVVSGKYGKQSSIYKKLAALKKKGKTIFGFAGRFVEEKGFDVLLDAIPRVVDKNPNAHFVFAGDTKIPYENFYQNTLTKISPVKRHLTLLGLLDNNDLRAFYDLIDFIVIPSRSDCFNMVQAEAMLQGKPSIVSNIPGSRFLVKESGFGLVFESQNALELSRTIGEAIKRKGPIVKNKARVLKILNGPSVLARIESFLLD